MRGRVAAVVQEVDLAAVRVVPVDLVRVRECVRRRCDVVLPVADAGRPRGVGHGVLRAAVVPRVLHGRPDVPEVREVVGVQRLE